MAMQVFYERLLSSEDCGIKQKGHLQSLMKVSREKILAAQSELAPWFVWDY